MPSAIAKIRQEMIGIRSGMHGPLGDGRDQISHACLPERVARVDELVGPALEAALDSHLPLRIRR
eukprot:6207205-Pleurochrysis_carterae.AAC.3